MEHQTGTKKRRRIIILVVILLVLGIAGFWAWKHFSAQKNKGDLKVNVSMARITVTDIDGERIKFTAHIVVSNPLPININTTRFQYKMYIDTSFVLESSYDKPLTVNSSDSTMLDIPMEVSLKRMVGIMKAFEEQKADSADYRLQADIYLKVPVAGEKKFDFDVTKRFPAILLPKIKLADTDLKKLNFKGMGIDIALTVENPNSFPLKLRNGHVWLTVDEKLDLEATLPEMITIKERSSETVPMHFDIKAEKVGSLVWKALFEKENTTFFVKFKGITDTESKLLDNTNMVITARGTFAEALKAAKELSK